MPKIRKQYQKGFTTLDNTPLNDKSLTWKAKGLFVYLWSKPDDWDYRVTEVAKHSKDGIGSTSTGVTELEQAGYLKRKQKNENGVFGDSVWTLSERPIFKNPISDNPYTEKPYTQNRALLNTDKQNTDSTKSSSSTDSKQQISAYWQKEFKTVTNGVVEEHIGNWVDEFGADLVKHYIDYSLEHQIDRSHVVSYMDSIFNRCRKEGIKSVADAKKAEQQHKEKSASRFKPYKQHKSVNKEHYHLPTNDAGLTQTEALQRILAKEAEEDRLKAEQQKKEGKS